MADWLKWADCSHCGGSGYFANTGYNSQCLMCEMHSQLAEKDKAIAALKADVRFFRVHGGQKTITEIMTAANANEVRAEAWYERERLVVTLQAEVEKLICQLERYGISYPAEEKGKAE